MQNIEPRTDCLGGDPRVESEVGGAPGLLTLAPRLVFPPPWRHHTLNSRVQGTQVELSKGGQSWQYHPPWPCDLGQTALLLRASIS